MPDYPEEVMDVLRQRRGLEPEDESQDEDIKKMEPHDAMRELLGWHLGDVAWYGWILRRLEMVGLKIVPTTE